MRMLGGLQVQWGYDVLSKDAKTLRATIGCYAGSGGDSEVARLGMLAALSDLQMMLLAHRIVYQHVRPRPHAIALRCMLPVMRSLVPVICTHACTQMGHAQLALTMPSVRTGIIAWTCSACTLLEENLRHVAMSDVENPAKSEA